MKEDRKMTEGMLEFVNASPSCFHTIANIEDSLREAGYVRLSEKQNWEIVSGGQYYVTRNDSSVIAFQVPKTEEILGFHVVASHSDSPSFKVKENPEIIVEEQYIKLNTEKYGGMILSTWLDRALSVAGRIAVRREEKITTQLVNVDEDLFVIPNMAIHIVEDNR